GSECVELEDQSTHCLPASCAGDSDCAVGTHCDLKTQQCKWLDCGDDGTCPCGSYCDPDTHHRRLNRLTRPRPGDLRPGCNGSQQGDGRGRCPAPDGTMQPPPVALVLAANPPALTMTPAADGSWPIVSLTITLSTTDAVAGTHAPPVVRVIPSSDVEDAP